MKALKSQTEDVNWKRQNTEVQDEIQKQIKLFLRLSSQDLDNRRRSIVSQGRFIPKEEDGAVPQSQSERGE
jgi:hypothetical protein